MMWRLSLSIITKFKAQQIRFYLRCALARRPLVTAQSIDITDSDHGTTGSAINTAVSYVEQI